MREYDTLRKRRYIQEKKVAEPAELGFNNKN